MGKQAHEFGNSLNDFISQVSRTFNDQYYDYWVMDVFDDHIICLEMSNERQKYKVSMSKGAEGELKFGEQATWEKVKLDYVKEMEVFVHNISEINHLNIDVPTRSNVNLEELVKGDPSPFFLTLEIARQNATSSNGLIYDSHLIKSIVKQINDSPIEGIMGHLSNSDRSVAYKPSDIHWLGAAELGDKAYAKGYIPVTATAQREHFRILKSTGGKAATSIYGWAQQEPVDAKKGTWKATEFDLEQLDLAPYTRAALQPTSGFVISSEMEGEQKIMGDTATPQVVSVSEYDELKKEVAELRRKEFRTQIGKQVSEAVNWSVTTDAGKEAVKAFRLFVAEYTSQFAKDETEAKDVIAKVMEDLKPVTTLLVKALSGPTSNGSQKIAPGAFVDTPEKREQARAEFNLIN